jgi:hypothetical protein
MKMAENIPFSHAQRATPPPMCTHAHMPLREQGLRKMIGTCKLVAACREEAF